MSGFLNIFLVFTVLLYVQQCGKEEVGESIPACMEAKIRDILAEDVWNPPAKVYRYVFNGETVYYIPQRCCDIPSQLYDEDCNLICAPDGGFSGQGDNRCPDFFSTRTAEELVWEDERE